MKLKIGDRVENFIAPAVDKTGVIETFDLHSIDSEFIVIYFYPRDATPGCTTQADNLTQHFEELNNNNITILGVSKDSVESHIKFINKKDIPFMLISDENTQICEQFGVFGEKKFMGKTHLGIFRTTFILDSSFKIIEIIEKPKVKNHSEEILSLISSN